MSTLGIPNRPFATDLITGLMTPDGIFVTMLGKQNITVQVTNLGAAPSEFSTVYIESTSHPGIVVEPRTHSVGALQSGAGTVLAWEADFTSCPAGNHYVSFIAETPSGRARIIKKIFVLGVTFDSTQGFVAECPEGVMTVKFGDLVKPTRRCCGGRPKPPNGDGPNGPEDPCKPRKYPKGQQRPSAIFEFAQLFRGHERDFVFCPPGYLPKAVEYTWTPHPPYPGQYGDLPFSDPWWKIVLAVIAFLLLVAASIAEAVDGSGEVVASVENPPSSSGPVEDCCGVEASGGGTSYVAAGLVAAAAAVATAAGLSDARDAFRIGQDKTPPAAGEVTTSEVFFTEFSYPEAVALGRPFSVTADWRYTRVTTGGSYTHAQQDTHQNVHFVSSYEVTAPEVAFRDNPDRHWIVTARFLDPEGKPFKGTALFVQCILLGPNGEWHRFYLQDDGQWPDDVHNDGTYSGRFDFRRVKAAKGIWQYFVIAQDVNDANPNLTPEEAAQIIGGMVLTQQLTLTFTEDECRFVPDGHVLVV